MMIFDLIKLRFYQGRQYIKNIKKAEINKQFRGYPILDASNCEETCNECKKVCPTNAISTNSLKIDLGKCIFCGDCFRACKDKKIKFSNIHKLAVDSPEKLIVEAGLTIKDFENKAVIAKKEITKIFGRSLKLRSVSAGGCSACELELNACSNVNFDMGRFGIDMVASPRHADGIIITGPITENMAEALESTYQSVPEPKIIILAGTCAISGGIFANSQSLKRDFLKNNKATLYIPGCPIHPLTVINGILKILGR